jgi:hypothetical protein
MVQDSKKLSIQVEDGRSISDKMSMIIRRLDLMQIRAQQALACTEDIQLYPPYITPKLNNIKPTGNSIEARDMSRR